MERVKREICAIFYGVKPREEQERTIVPIACGFLKWTVMEWGDNSPESPNTPRRIDTHKQENANKPVWGTTGILKKEL